MEIPTKYKGLYLVKKYPNFALYIDPKTGFRECFSYYELNPPPQIELSKPAFNFKTKAKKKRRKRIW